MAEQDTLPAKDDRGRNLMLGARAHHGSYFQGSSFPDRATDLGQVSSTRSLTGMPGQVRRPAELAALCVVGIEVERRGDHHEVAVGGDGVYAGRPEVDPPRDVRGVRVHAEE